MNQDLHPLLFLVCPYWWRGGGKVVGSGGGIKIQYLLSDSSVYKVLSAHVCIHCPSPYRITFTLLLHLIFSKTDAHFPAFFPSITDDHDHTTTTAVMTIMNSHLLSHHYGQDDAVWFAYIPPLFLTPVLWIGFNPPLPLWIWKLRQMEAKWSRDFQWLRPDYHLLSELSVLVWIQPLNAHSPCVAVDSYYPHDFL